MKIEKIIMFSVLLALIACHAERDEDISSIIADRTIIVYMSADNDLSADALNDLEEMKKGYRDKGVHLVVFADLTRELPYLLEIAPESGKTVKTYPEINSANASQMQEVLKDIIDLYPARSYGLILWSHGTSWLPSNTQLRSFGRDHGSEMDIPELAKALPVKFDFILMDACLMGAVEVAYELKDKTEIIIASPMEIIYRGFPYDRVIPELVKPVIDYTFVARHYFDYYEGMQGVYRSATISVIETRYLRGLAHQVKRLFESNIAGFHPFERTAVQRMDTYEEQYCFDLADFVNTIFPEPDKSLFTEELNKAVVYKAYTQMFLSEYEIKKHCGLSCYIPHPLREDLNNYHKTLQWYKDSGMDTLNSFTINDP